MIDIPQIFDRDGKLIELDASTMPPDMAARYATVRNAYALNAKAEQDLADANAEVKRALEAANNTREYYNAHFPRQTQHDLWRENFGGGPHDTMRRHGLIK
jgi:hypothetical protein